MFKHAAPLDDLQIKTFAKRYGENTALQVAANALYKTELSRVAAKRPQDEFTGFHFGVDIPTMKATNQKQSGRCWIFAALNLLREQVAARANLAQFELSQNYIAFWDKLEKANWYLECVAHLAERPADDRTLTWVLQNAMVDGGQWDMLVNLVQKYGLVPKSAMPETATSGATRALNQMLHTRLVRAAAKIRAEVAAGKPAGQMAHTREKAMEDIYNMLCCTLGTPPETFNFEYTDKDGAYHNARALTPQQFYKTYTEANLQQYVSVINAPTQDKPYYKTFTVEYLGNVVGGRPILYLNLPFEEMEGLVLQSLQAGRPVWFGADVAPYGDREAGIWDDGAFGYEELFGTSFAVCKTDALDLRLSAMGHAMLITGAALNEDEKPVKWKIQNSWSDKNGEKGYYVMSESWAQKYMYQAVVHQSLLGADAQKALAQKPAHLNPWDPMGSLALCR